MVNVAWMGEMRKHTRREQVELTGIHGAQTLIRFLKEARHDKVLLM
jgi:hypothetical protein